VLTSSPGPRLDRDGLRQRDLTKAGQASESSPSPNTGRTPPAPSPACSSSTQLTSYKILDELTGRGIHGSPAQARPQDPAAARRTAASAWTRVKIERAAATATHLHEDTITWTASAAGPPDRRQEHRPRRATLLITSHPTGRQRPVHPIRRTDDHRKRARRLHQRLPPQRLSSGVPLNVDLDTPDAAGNLYRMFARSLTGTRTPPPKPSGATSSTHRTLHLTGDTSPAPSTSATTTPSSSRPDTDTALPILAEQDPALHVPAR